MPIETDSLGPVQVPEGVLWGPETTRAVQNFAISGRPLPGLLNRAGGFLKMAAATVHTRHHRLPPELGEAIVRAAREISQGTWHDQFVVDSYQAGAGTSWHMNLNEVIANRALALMGKAKGDYACLHPHDHVNMSQSTNDVFPSAIRVAALMALPPLFNALDQLVSTLEAKREAFWPIIKSGRTHLQDAVPLRLGQEVGAWASALAHQRTTLTRTSRRLHDLGLGGTAVGTGLNAPPGYREEVVAELAQLTQLSLKPARDPFEAMQSLAPLTAVSGSLRNLALELTRIANDIRLLSSGPRTGLAELQLPAVQPGSSIMPGKVNPSMSEMLNMVCFQVIGYDQAIALAAQAGQLELNVMMPLVAHNLLDGISLLAGAIQTFNDKAILGMEAKPANIRRYTEESLALATALVPRIGYEAAAQLSQEAFQTGETIAEICVRKGVLVPEEAQDMLDPAKLVGDKH